MMLMFQIAGGIILAPMIVIVVCSIIDGLQEMMPKRQEPLHRPSPVITRKEAEKMDYHYFDGAYYSRLVDGQLEYVGEVQLRGEP